MMSENKLIGVIDAGTNKVKFNTYEIPNFNLVCSHEIEIKQICTKDGWLEHDPIEIINAVRDAAKIVLSILPNYGFSKNNIATLGITNQVESSLKLMRF